MAVEYELRWRPALPPERATALLAELLDRPEVDGRTIRGRALEVTVSSLGALTREVTDECWGLPAEMGATFRLENNAPEEDYFGAVRDSALAAVRLAYDHDLDAVFLFNGESLLMSRLGGVLSVYTGWSHWEGLDILPALPGPFERVPGPLPLA